jgi:HB1, ASXL, restriction endonuclease HTH domain
MAASKSPKKAKSKKTKEAADDKKLSALDAAAKVLAETGQPMSCKELIEAMAQKGYWSSPGGQTPASTLYSGITKEIATKGKESRFQKTDRGRFART